MYGYGIYTLSIPYLFLIRKDCFLLENKKIGMKLKELRLARDLKQCEVADALNLSRSAISNIENGRRSLTMNTLNSFANFYKIDVSTITEEYGNSKDELLDLIERSRKVFQSEHISKDDKDDLYLTLMTMYLNTKK